MSRILVDVTLPISERLPVWPGDPPVRVAQVSEGLPIVSRLSMSVHAGTHVDAPAHFLPRGCGGG
jgi:arylformamidase